MQQPITNSTSAEVIERSVRGVCSHDCPDSCAWDVTVRDEKATALRGAPDHPITRGGLCAKVSHFLERVYNPDRVLYPLKRTGPKGAGEFTRVSWDEALSDVAARLNKMIETVGPQAILPFSFAGSQGLLEYCSLDRRFASFVGTSQLERSLCGDTASAGLAATQGNAKGIDPLDLAHSRFIVLWGTNTMTNNLHLWPTIRQAQSAGAKIVVIDPLVTKTAAAADWHIRPFPGSDGALALGMMHVIVREKLHDSDYIQAHTKGFEKLRERLQEYSPEKVSRITGLSEDEIERFAIAYASTAPAAIRLMIGLEHHENGAMMFRTIACLPALIGAWKVRGGGLVRSTFAVLGEMLNFDKLTRPDLARASSRVFNMARLGEILNDTTLDPKVDALLVYNCNPAVIVPNAASVRRGLEREDLLTVVLDQFVTDTAKYADYVFPASTQIEKLDIVPSWGFLNIALNRPAIEPLGESVSNTEFFRRLSKAMGLTEAALFDDDETLVRDVLDVEHPWMHNVNFESLSENGWRRVDVPDGWLPFKDGGFTTPSGKLEFYSESLEAAGFDPLPEFKPLEESPGGNAQLFARYPLILITKKSSHFLNTCYSNMARHRRSEEPCSIDICRQDAEHRGISDGDVVEVFNDRGCISVTARISDKVRAGLVSMPFAWPAEGERNKGVANMLTNDQLSDWGGGAAFHDTLVEVRQAAVENSTEEMP
ncbi:molybdopterin-containing oxidoreductase family protein [Trinickia acidisoli]|uniref:molybdopterin-containing oxidoreductase family protein n=1 Tax=Trinickia acidisoli TaxID=2767482 RepID=UPI001A90BC37|nr:molybdopterin-dependent oxidoreductase [Trinickia acidisoli]